MKLGSRQLVDRSFTAAAMASVAFLVLALVFVLCPIIVRGAGAVVFRGTVEHRRLLMTQFGRGDAEEIEADVTAARTACQPVFDTVAAFDRELQAGDAATRSKYAAPFRELGDRLRTLLGPLPGDPTPVLMRNQYGQVRWDRALVKQRDLLFRETYDFSEPGQMGRRVWVPRVNEFEGTLLVPLFAYVQDNLERMLRPRWTVYGGFLFDNSYDAHFFGGVWPELLGTFYLTLGAVLFAVPVGLISAIYLVEYARADSRLVSLLRTCISTLAGVPSIVFGLFGLAFFINALHVSASKSVLAGSLTLALLILPFFIRASEEAIRAVPWTYKEAALSLGATKWRTIVGVVLPAAMPGILTGIVISMGRAAGETAPIIFTAAVSVGPALTLAETLSQPTPALPWNIYNLCSEHQAVDEIRHVQFGMVLTLVGLVLLMNSSAIWLRARLAKRLRA